MQIRGDDNGHKGVFPRLHIATDGTAVTSVVASKRKAAPAWSASAAKLVWPAAIQ
ncbi:MULTISPECIES: hypothetical protein [Sutterella]|uniref:hypothetical protein n=1 Tax=Sutterella TaxID=40544 RepID=UPI0013FCFF91|nr:MULTISPECIES: hypothetical protein [Sutterella]